MGLGAAGAGGGSIVFLTGPENGEAGIDTLRGGHLLARGPNALCTVAEQSMRVCPLDAQHTGDVMVLDSFDGGRAQTRTIARGSPLAFYEYVAGGGITKAVVAIEVSLSPGEAVGALGSPVNSGESIGAYPAPEISSASLSDRPFRSRAADMARRRTLSLPRWPTSE